MVRLRISLQGMNVSQCNVLKNDGNKRVCVCVHYHQHGLLASLSAVHNGHQCCT